MVSAILSAPLTASVILLPILSAIEPTFCSPEPNPFAALAVSAIEAVEEDIAEEIPVIWLLKASALCPAAVKVLLKLSVNVRVAPIVKSDIYITSFSVLLLLRAVLLLS
jgi:hypothetical protein